MKKDRAWIITSLAIVLLGVAIFTSADPIGPRLLFNNTETPGTVTSGLLLNHTKGRITTLRLNVTQPDEDWKGYVGNVTGKLTLDDASNNTLFDWTFSTIQGEVYATRGSSVTWSTIDCANTTHITTEDSALNHLTSQSDSINSTFTNTSHPEFYLGDTQFAADHCNHTLFTYVSNELTGQQFPELLLYDSTNGNVIYTAVLNDTTAGFDGGVYDFQMIVSEDSSLTPNIGYYFYVEVG